MFLKIDDYMLPCINKKLFGFDCMGCGIQRSIAFILKGEFLSAFKMYPAIYTLLLLFIFILISFKFKIKKSNTIILALFFINAILITGNFIIKIIT